MKAYSFLARSPRLFTVSQKLAALATRLISPFGEFVRLPAFTGWGYSKDLPKFSGKSFRDRFASLDTTTQVNTYASTQGVVERKRSEQAPPERTALASQFTEELTKVNGNVIRTTSKELTQRVIDFLQSRDIDNIHLEPDTLDEQALQRAGITISHAPDPTLRVGITQAVCGLADTGSILVADGEGNPLQASLLPEIHIAVLSASSILPSLEDSIRLPVVRESRASVVITGPSRTADIEMSLTIGMHGPGELHVFLVDENAGPLVHRTASTLVHGTVSTLVDD